MIDTVTGEISFLYLPNFGNFSQDPRSQVLAGHAPMTECQFPPRLPQPLNDSWTLGDLSMVSPEGGKEDVDRSAARKIQCRQARILFYFFIKVAESQTPPTFDGPFSSVSTPIAMTTGPRSKEVYLTSVSEEGGKRKQKKKWISFSIGLVQSAYQF